jgi:hypothetical protein
MVTRRPLVEIGDAALILVTCATLCGQAQPVPESDSRLPQSAPVAPPHGFRELDPNPSPAARAGLAASPAYSIGEPTDEEQLYVEFINRARANPQVEVVRYTSTTDTDILRAYSVFKVDLALLTSQFAGIATAPPVSINAHLTDAARVHTQDLFDHQFQGHTGTDGSDPGRRITRAGYSWQTWGENVYSTSYNVWYGHVGFQVDWGNGPGGMQTPPGHRNTIHNGAFREVGVGVVQGQNGSVGPQLVTQDFASAFNPKPFITGVVYFDFNANQFYDLGEGVGGVTVTVDNVPTHAVTSRSGGYSVPVPANGTYTVNFAVPGLSPVSKQVAISSLANAKVDHTPTYSAPVLGGTTVAFVGRDNSYPFSPVPAATSYEWRSLKRSPWTAPDGAEATPGLFVANVSAGYSVVAKDVRLLGTASYRLAHPAPARDQFLTLEKPIRLGANSVLSFASRLGWSGAGEVAMAQISVDDGRTWIDLWSQKGSGTSGESAFTRRSFPLSAYGGATAILRFSYVNLPGGSYFPQVTNSGVGLYLDEILVSNAETLGDEKVAVAGNGVLTFRPGAEGLYLLQVRASVGDRALHWGPALGITAQTGGPVEPPILRLGSLTPSGNGSWTLDFAVLSGTANSLRIEVAEAVNGPWGVENGATIRAAGAAGSYQATLPARAGNSRFVRVAAP